MTQQFNALQFESDRANKFEQSQTRHIELSSQHNYTDGITEFYVTFGDIDLGCYWRSAWGDCWLAKSNRTGVVEEADTQEEAISIIEKSWEI